MAGSTNSNRSGSLGFENKLWAAALVAHFGRQLESPARLVEQYPPVQVVSFTSDGQQMLMADRPPQRANSNRRQS